MKYIVDKVSKTVTIFENDQFELNSILEYYNNSGYEIVNPDNYHTFMINSSGFAGKYYDIELIEQDASFSMTKITELENRIKFLEGELNNLLDRLTILEYRK